MRFVVWLVQYLAVLPLGDLVVIHKVLNFTDVVLPSPVLLFKDYLISEKMFYDHR